MALVILELEPLEVRREQLCKTFAKKTLKSKHSRRVLINTIPETSLNFSCQIGIPRGTSTLLKTI
jgi:hypothetical protein